MPKILFVISSDLYVRNYLRTGVVESLKINHQVDLICQDNLELREEVENDPSFLGTFEVPARAHRRRMFFFHVLMWRFRKKSKTFLYRWQRMAGWGLLPTEKNPIGRILGVARIFWSLLKNPRPLLLSLCGSRIVFPLATWIYEKSEEVSPQVKYLISRERYDAIVFPSAAFETVIPDLVLSSREAGIPTLSLIDNWDNLTSKTVYWFKPDHLGVWGEQAKGQAVEIHDFFPDNVHPVGTPRFDSYFELRELAEVPKIYDFPYILFVGSALPFDEIAALHLLENILEKSTGIAEDLKIVYRPHPWQQKRKVSAHFDERKFKRSVLDTQIREAYSRGVKAETTHNSFQPDLDYYPRLLINASIVVGPLTTMLFEAALCLKPVIALAYSDGHHFTTNRRYLSHFDGLESVPGFAFCDDPSNLPDAVLFALQGDEIQAKESDEVTKYFLHRNSSSYPDRLQDLVRDIVGPTQALAPDH